MGIIHVMSFPDQLKAIYTPDTVPVQEKHRAGPHTYYYGVHSLNGRSPGSGTWFACRPTGLAESALVQLLDAPISR